MASERGSDENRFHISADWTAPTALVLLWAGLSILGVRRLGLQRRVSQRLALITVLGHCFSVVWHHLGHGVAAARTGYPMRGIHFWGIIATSVYPRDEPVLTAHVHIRRALGGPKASAVLTLVLGGLLQTTPPSARVRRLALWNLFLDNLLLFTLQALLPLGFNDGATIRRWTRNLSENE